MKYKGPLAKLPLLAPEESPDQTDRYWVHMTSVGIKKPGQAEKKYSQSATPVFLDSGSSLSNLPSAIVNQMVADFPDAKFIPEIQMYQIDCAHVGQDGFFSFSFGSMVIDVPYKEFIKTVDGQNCFLGTLINEVGISLGGEFLSISHQGIL